MSLVAGGSQTYSKHPSRYPKGAPPVVYRADGPYVWDEAGRRYVDYVSGLGAVILGHRWPAVEARVAAQMGQGICFPLPHIVEEEAAGFIHAAVPCAGLVRFAKNGADATAGAVRLARAATGRVAVLRTGYHGYQDWCIEHSQGVPAAVKALTHRVPFGDISALEAAIGAHNPACYILEPILAATMDQGPLGFLRRVHRLCHASGTLLIFDETVSGFRMAWGGVQRASGVTPDLASFGKAVANGYPISVLCGRADLMERLASATGVFFSTTFGGDGLGLAALCATLGALEPQFPRLLAFGERFAGGFAAATTGLPVLLRGCGARYVEEWLPGAEGERDRFRSAVVAAGVLYQGAYNLTVSHAEPEVWETTHRAWLVASSAMRKS